MMNFKPAASLTEQIADHLSSEIVAGRLEPQARIQELKVAKDLGVSRGSVREALLILESRHLIDIVPRRGAVVSSLDDDHVRGLSEIVAELVTLLFNRLAEVYPRLNAGDQRVLQEAAAAIAGCCDGEDTSLSDAKYHFIRSAIPLTRNPYLESVLCDLLLPAKRVTELARQHPSFDPGDLVRFARSVLQAVEDQDAERINDLVHGHFRREQTLARSAEIH
jgi:DNA-binding GntR family transcriptional regulator